MISENGSVLCFNYLPTQFKIQFLADQHRNYKSIAPEKVLITRIENKGTQKRLCISGLVFIDLVAVETTVRKQEPSC